MLNMLRNSSIHKDQMSLSCREETLLEEEVVVRVQNEPASREYSDKVTSDVPSKWRATATTTCPEETSCGVAS